MVGCCVPSCRNSSAKGFVMLRFPKNEERRHKWALAMGKENWVPTDGVRICEEHFEKDQWQKFRSRLNTEAVPTDICLCSSVQQSVKSQPLRAKNVVNIPYEDHSYCQQVIHEVHCYKSRRTSDMEANAYEILSRNCLLEKQLIDLTQQLKKAEEKVCQPEKIESSVLLSCENIKKAEEDRKCLSYSMNEVKKGLKIQFACGTSGLKAVSEEVQQQPSVRTLQRRTQHITFEPGVQHDIISAVKEKLSGEPSICDRDCNLFFDEMSIKQQMCYDQGSKRYRGHATLPGHEHEMACKCEVYMFGGTKKKWKQVVGWHATPAGGCNNSKRDTVIELLKEADGAGLNVTSVVCDMGNRGLLSSIGFSTQKNAIKFCIPNPAKPSEKLWLVPDAVHLFKSLKEMMCSNRYFTISEDICDDFSLKSKVVDLAHIEWLEEYQRGEDLKFVPRFVLKDIKTGHFGKMNFKSAHQMISHKVGSSLSYLAAKGVVPQEFCTTAWFVKVMNRWRELMTSKSITHAFSRTVPEAYEEAISHLNLVIRIFKGMVVSGGWKPEQTHILLATESVLQIQKYLIDDRGYKFVLMARFSQDIVENLFSVIRLQRPVPTVVEFKY